MFLHFKMFIKEEIKTKLQFVEAHENCVNSAEHAIQTFKSSFVEGLCTVNLTFPMKLWCELLHQTELTLNLIRTARDTPNLSVYDVLEGS